MNPVPSPAYPQDTRKAVTMERFASLFGRERTWAYRLLYRQLIRVVRVNGTYYVPMAEVDRLLAHGDEALPRRGRPRKVPAP